MEYLRQNVYLVSVTSAFGQKKEERVFEGHGKNTPTFLFPVDSLQIIQENQGLVWLLSWKRALHLGVRYRTFRRPPRLAEAMNVSYQFISCEAAVAKTT